ncbi:MAG: phosphoadenylyl-sulfate reductase [Myxococcales bacterium]|nr:phosphoadenylyl-sulfate reductase [Myxococcales bacterium]MCB9533720.1 phosphoadenylyl-sulfate reductase [Myxococcales bacterium]
MNELLSRPVALSDATLERLDRRFADAPAEAAIEYAIERFGSRLVVASSFGAEDVVLIDIAARIDPSVRVFTLDTGRLHQETYEVMDAIVERYGIRLEVMVPNQVSLQELVREKGNNSFYASIEDRRECCQVRKLEPLRRVLDTADAWVTGLRREQSITRAEVATVERDITNGGLVKFNPLASWSRADVWTYIERHGVPYNRLHDRGFPSIGCAPCTRAVLPGEDERAGRWWWERPEHKECGLHARAGLHQSSATH